MTISDTIHASCGLAIIFAAFCLLGLMWSVPLLLIKIFGTACALSFTTMTCLILYDIA